MKIAVLMYHAIPRRRGELENADPRYAVDTDAFRHHLRQAAARGLAVRSVRDLLAGAAGGGQGAVGLTFDDGHESNFSQAFPLLQDLGATADFFVNPAVVGGKGFVTWAALREMADHGMSIQSHGYTHRYFDDLARDEVRRELYESKAMLEDRLGRPVNLFAPPGGRITPEVTRIAWELGYEAVCTSRPGCWNGRGGRREIPRLAVLATTTGQAVDAWMIGRTAAVAVQAARYRLARWAKRALGNRRYDAVRSSLLRLAGRPGSAG